jgi:hypothetical protein
VQQRGRGSSPDTAAFPRLPHQNGKVKRRRRTDLADCWCTTSPTAADAIKRLAERQNHVSRVDLHSALDGAFPRQPPPGFAAADGGGA